MTKEEALETCGIGVTTTKKTYEAYSVLAKEPCDDVPDINDGNIKELEVLDKIRAEIEKQEKWLLQAGYTAYNVDIALDDIKAVVAESEGAEWAD